MLASGNFNSIQKCLKQNLEMAANSFIGAEVIFQASSENFNSVLVSG